MVGQQPNQTGQAQPLSLKDREDAIALCTGLHSSLLGFHMVTVSISFVAFDANGYGVCPAGVKVIGMGFCQSPQHLQVL